MKKIYEMLDYIVSEWNGKVCVFGAGELGSGKVYDLMKLSGIKIDCYIDNYVKAGTLVRDAIYVKAPEYLYEHSDEFYVVACFGGKYKDEIKDQLVKHGVSQYCFIDWKGVKCFFDDLDEAPIYIKQRYSEIYDDELFLMKQYKEMTGLELDLYHPRCFNEKLQWIKLNYRVPQMIAYADKYTAKELVRKRIGEVYIIPTIGIWDRFEEIDFESLPDRFVIKCTHDSGGVVICKDKETFNLEKARELFEKNLNRNYYWHAREWPYKFIRPRIIAEEFIGDGIEEINDYKIFCFNGVPKLIQVDFDRSGNHRRNLYTTDWQYIEGSILYPTDKDHVIERPAELEEMLHIASILSEGFLHVRVDLYNYAGRVYFGEMTFTHGAGYEKFTPPELGIRLGDYIELPIDDRDA